ncbi:MAG: glycosyltransferase family 2 protein [Candidatus Levybacteria bacterium]|nr:glycosyltransferase family 2 protein [Candidatus Levybacteria bacterium]
MIDLSIIIISYNTKNILLDCVGSIKGSIYGVKLNIEIIIVDNFSTDGSAEALRREYPDVILIQNKENVGFSKANNIGIKKAKGRYILFLNSDTIVYKKTLETMVEFMDKNEAAGAATCKVIMPDGKLDDASHRGFPTPINSLFYFSGLSKLFPKSKRFAGYNLSYMDLNATHEIDACAGAFMIVRRQAGEKIGWWDEDFFWYGDDLDFCYRLKKAGYKIYYVQEVKILHYKGVSGGIKDSSKHLSSADKETKKQAQEARFEAMRIFYNKHYKKLYPNFVTWLIYGGIDLKEWMSSR